MQALGLGYLGSDAHKIEGRKEIKKESDFFYSLNFIFLSEAKWCEMKSVETLREEKWALKEWIAIVEGDPTPTNSVLLVQLFLNLAEVQKKLEAS